MVLTCPDPFCAGSAAYHLPHNHHHYFVDLQTSGFVEGLNNKLKVLKRLCYRIFNLEHLFQLIFLGRGINNTAES
jgi:Transposase